MKIYVLRRGRWVAAGCLVIAAAMFWLVSHPAAVGAAAIERELPVYYVQSEEKRVALTFDAAWGNEDTEELIAILNEADIHATFFLVGEWVEKYPESVKQLYEAGNEIGNHSSTHPYMTQCSREEMLKELTACNQKVEAITGECPVMFRCPYGDYDNTVVSTIRSIDMEAVQWNVDSLDWKGISASEITQNVLSKVVPGSIVLFHNAADHTPEALPGIIQSLKEQGYTFYTVSELLEEGESNGYTIAHDGMMIPAADTEPEQTAE